MSQLSCNAASSKSAFWARSIEKINRWSEENLKNITTTSYRLENFGYAECDWRKGDKPYERIYGILLDVRSIMQRHPKSSDKDIEELASLIEENAKRNGPMKIQQPQLAI